MSAPSQYGDAVIAPGFIARKSKILSDLSVPDAEYTDLSPKGSVDEGIRDLIRDINALDGLVTTSSCAGRVSVFVESSNNNKRTDNDPKLKESLGGTNQQGQTQTNVNINANSTGDGEDEVEVEGRKFAPTGGKGEGRWLYVSHDPVNLDSVENNMKTSYHELFGLVPGDGIPKSNASEDGSIRLIRFHYDPMILHVMAATLHHAHPVLAAASSAGFRESGLQSLRCLESSSSQSSKGSSRHSSLAESSASHSPIVAVRSSGLALESIIGYCEYNNDVDDTAPVMRSLVTEECLRMLVSLANERFQVNKERVERFRVKLLDLYASTHNKKMASDWEDPLVRRERKRVEGLKRQAEAPLRKATIPEPDEAGIDMGFDF